MAYACPLWASASIAHVPRYPQKDGGVRKIIKKVGAGYEVPEKGDKVTGLFGLE